MSSHLVCVVTGAASGFGLLTARALAKAGHIVYAGMLAPDDGSTQDYADASTFSKENSCDMHAVQLNVVKDDSIRNAVDTILAEQKRIDVVVHNAGHMNLGPAEAFTPEQFHDMYEIKCVSCQRINRIVLPHMRQAGKGLLVWVSSSSAHGPSSPFLSAYFAAKAAQDSLAQSYAVEVAPFGIETSIIVPGVFTRGTNHFASAMKAADTTREKELMEGTLKGWDEVCLDGSGKMVPDDAEPQLVADAIVNVVGGEHGKRAFRVHVEPDDGGAESLNAVRDVVRKRFLTRMGCAPMMDVKVN